VGVGEIHMKELCVYYPCMLAELQFLHYINSTQYYNYKNAVYLSGLTLQSLLIIFCTTMFNIKKFYVLSEDYIYEYVSLGWYVREQTVIIFLYSLN